MATKKKAATKVATKKAIHTKKVEPAKKAVKPVLHTATHKSLSKPVAKPAEKRVTASGGNTKKVTVPLVIKHIEKSHIEKTTAAKPSKTSSKTAIPIKTEHVKNTFKKLENKHHENSVNQSSTPRHVKQTQKKEAATPKPEKEAILKPVREVPAPKPIKEAVAPKPVKEAATTKPAKEAATTKPAKEAATTKPAKEAAATKPAKEPTAAKPAKVAMPDIKTKTVRKYEPDFTKSVLDTRMQDQSAPSQRYSDTDLNEFRELINKKLDAAKKELNYLQGLITRKDEMGGDESDNRYMTMEDGSISMEREQLSQMASRQITFIDHLEKAIMRIENKTYGICRVTGKLIDKARLRAVPHATLSIEAKQTMNK